MNKRHSYTLISVLTLSCFSFTYATSPQCTALSTKIEQRIATLKRYDDELSLRGAQLALELLKKNCQPTEQVVTLQKIITTKQTLAAKYLQQTNKSEKALAEALDNDDEKKITQYEESVIENQQILEELQEEIETSQYALELLQNL